MVSMLLCYRCILTCQGVYVQLGHRMRTSHGVYITMLPVHTHLSGCLCPHVSVHLRMSWCLCPFVSAIPRLLWCPMSICVSDSPLVVVSFYLCQCIPACHNVYFYLYQCILACHDVYIFLCQNIIGCQDVYVHLCPCIVHNYVHICRRILASQVSPHLCPFVKLLSFHVFVVHYWTLKPWQVSLLSWNTVDKGKDSNIKFAILKQAFIVWDCQSNLFMVFITLLIRHFNPRIYINNILYIYILI